MIATNSPGDGKYCSRSPASKRASRAYLIAENRLTCFFENRLGLMHRLEPSASPRDDTKDVAWPVMVLAHNEARNIVACLDSIYAADPGHAFSIFVMANGCTDDTERIVNEYAETHDGTKLV